MMKPIDPSLAHRLFYPGVPAVLAARSGNTVSGMPVISYVALSERPPLFGVSCARRSFTLALATKAKAFSLCLLGAEHVDSMARLASIRGKTGADKLAEAGFQHRPGSRTGAPIVSGSVAALECSLRKRERTGDHFLLIGRIESSTASGDFRGYWLFKNYDPILYTGWRGGMSTFRRR